VALLALMLGGLGFAAMRRRRRDEHDLGRILDETNVADSSDATSKLSSVRKDNDSFVVEESGAHPIPGFAAADRFGDSGATALPEDTMSSESAVNLDQGDPLAEADFHMAYGLYDQAADLLRMALEREPDRRDLRLKLLEVYFVWGNRDAFLQIAKDLAATRDRAPAGEWDKIVIMGKQICPDEALFAAGSSSARGVATVVDLNLEGGENRVDIDLFGDPEGERSTLGYQLAGERDDKPSTTKSTGLFAGSDLDFTLDAPERGADESPTREMPPRDEPTVESELMDFADVNFIEPPADAPTTGSPPPKGSETRDRIASKLPSKADQTAEMSIDDLGLDLDQLEQTGTPSSNSISPLEETDHSHDHDAPTMVAGLDERSRGMMAEAEKDARGSDLSGLESELEASFLIDLDSPHDEIKTGTPERKVDASSADVDATSRLRRLDGESMDLDLDDLASALGSGDTMKQPRAEEEVFSSDVFEASQRHELMDLDVGEPTITSDEPAPNVHAQTNKLAALDLPTSEFEPVTMSEVGTKLDLARAYMDMGDPEGARSILEEVIQEGSASQKQEASRLIESLPG